MQNMQTVQGFFRSGMKNEGKERMKWDDLIAGEGVVEKIIFFAFFVKIFASHTSVFVRSFWRKFTYVGLQCHGHAHICL